MWEMPATLLYPLYGFGFPKGTVMGENWYDYFLLVFNRSYAPALSYVFVLKEKINSFFGKALGCTPVERKIWNRQRKICDFTCRVDKRRTGYRDF